MTITLHKKHGLNPTMDTCFYCGKAKDILLIGNKTIKWEKAGIASSDGKMPQQIGVINDEPCQECKGFMEKGIILVSVKDEEEDRNEKNPFRTGKMCVITEEAIKRILQGDLLNSILKTRFSFILDEAWKKLGLPV